MRTREEIRLDENRTKNKDKEIVKEEEEDDEETIVDGEEEEE